MGIKDLTAVGHIQERAKLPPLWQDYLHTTKCWYRVWLDANTYTAVCKYSSLMVIMHLKSLWLRRKRQEEEKEEQK